MKTILCLLLIAVSTRVYCQISLPSREIVKAYLDDNLKFIKKQVEDDKFQFHHLQTHYDNNDVFRNYVEFTKKLRYTNFQVRMYQEADDYVISAGMRDYSFHRDKAAVTEWFFDQVNLDGNSLSQVFYDGIYKPSNRPIIARILEIKERFGLSLVGVTEGQLKQLESSEVVANQSHMLFGGLRDEMGFRLNFMISIYTYVSDSQGKEPRAGELAGEIKFSLRGNEFSILTFFGIEASNDWGLIKCKTDGIHSYAPVSLAGTKYDYLTRCAIEPKRA